MAALRQLRSMGDLTLWIDGICIDQTFTAKRSAQVALIRDIDKQATKVVVGLVRNMRRAKRPFSMEGIALMSMDKGRMERCLPLLAGLQVKNDSDDPIGPLLKRSWFSCMRMIQEVTLPLQHHVHVLCGSILLSWVYLVTALDMPRACLAYPRRWTLRSQVQAARNL